MNIKRVMSMKWFILFQVCCYCLFNPFLNGATGQMNGPIFLDINAIKDQADVVLVGTLKSVSPPFEVLGKNFYEINPQEVLKGKLIKEGLLVIVTNIDSIEGSTPIIEPDFRYMLFLQQTKLEEKKAPSNIVFYKLVGNWKGIISLNKEASERRAVQNILKNYKINIYDMVPEFIMAMGYSLNEQARFIYETLGLNKNQRE